MTGLVWPRAVLDALRPWAEKCYPYEGCGLLLGRFEGPAKTVRRFAPLTNILREKKRDVFAVGTAAQTLGNRVNSEGQYEFVIDHAEFNRVVLEAGKEDLDVVGILHTHPDHPAQPSKTDAAQPLLAGWSNVIVKVDAGRFVEARSWVRDEETDPFREEPITVA